MSEERDVTGFWFVWREGWEWPEHYYSEEKARGRATLVAKSNPGMRVYVGDLRPIERLLLPDQLDVTKIQ